MGDLGWLATHCIYCGKKVRRLLALRSRRWPTASLHVGCIVRHILTTRQFINQERAFLHALEQTLKKGYRRR